MGEDEHEQRCDELSRKVARWIYDQLSGTRGVGLRGLTDLEGSIYGWLMDHAMFDARPVPHD